MRIGDPADETTQLGALITPAHREKVEGYIQVAHDEGGTIRCGGKRPDLPAPFSSGSFLQPTIITGLPQSSRCVQEEIFGPVATVQPFKTEAEAIQLANGVPYGLAASVWTNDDSEGKPRGGRPSIAAPSG